jgi:replicative DNA helicase
MDALMTAPDDISAIERMAPHDIQAEQAILGACLISGRVAREAVDTLDPVDFYRPGHGAILAAIKTMIGNGQPVDSRTLTAHLEKTGLLARVGGFVYISQLVDAVPTAANAEWYTHIVLGHALRRGLVEVGTRIAAMGFNPGDGEAHELAERAVAMVREVRDRGRDTADMPVMDLHDFLAVEETFDWLIPGLIERGDRLILTATEGGGKSTLIRQMAVCGAAGLHPFTHKPIDPFTVLLLDCENGESMTRRKLAPLTGIAAQFSRPVPRSRFFIECQPAGVDLTRARDRAWLLRRVEKTMPQMLVIGPIYRLHAGNPNDEELARKVSAVIDEARAISGCCVVMEAHAPHNNGFSQHRNMRPAGSSLWMRWPEFGYGLRPVEDEATAVKDWGRLLVPWRGARDERDWPTHLRKGDHWPWVSYQPNGPNGECW